MRFKLGALCGFAVGYVLGTRASAQQRARVSRVVDRITHDPRLRRATSTVGRNVGQVADSLTEQVTGAVDRVGDRVDDVIRPHDDVGPLSAAGH
jgi:hypothetical protein